MARSIPLSPVLRPEPEALAGEPPYGRPQAGLSPVPAQCRRQPRGAADPPPPGVVTARVVLSDTDATDLCRYIDLQAHAAFYRQWHPPYIALDELEDAGYEGLVQALETSTIPDKFHAFAKRRIWGNIRNLRLKKAHERTRVATFVRDLADACTGDAADTDARLAWLDAQLARHTTCLPAHLLTIYHAIRAGQGMGRGLARQWGITASALYCRYRQLHLFCQRHLVRQATTCRQEHGMATKSDEQVRQAHRQTASRAAAD